MGAKEKETKNDGAIPDAGKETRQKAGTKTGAEIATVLDGKDSAAGGTKKRKLISRIVLRSVIVLASITGIIASTGLFEGQPQPAFLSYFTTWANIAVFIVYMILLGKDISILQNKSQGGSLGIKNLYLSGAMHAILVVFLIFNCVLLPAQITNPGPLNFPLVSYMNFTLHYIAPLCVLFDYIFFLPKGTMKWFYPLLWLVFPVAYLIFGLIRGAVGGPLPFGTSTYPYFFMDIDMWGFGTVMLYSLAFAALFAGLGYLLYFIDSFDYSSLKKWWINRKGGEAGGENTSVQPDTPEAVKREPVKVVTDRGEYENPYIKKKESKKKKEEKIKKDKPAEENKEASEQQE